MGCKITKLPVMDNFDIYYYSAIIIQYNWFVSPLYKRLMEIKINLLKKKFKLRRLKDKENIRFLKGVLVNYV